jgi:menaquinone-dependent protoporphyrinogen oxidase
MRVLVSAASRHGATAVIGEQIGGVLARAGLLVDVRPPDEIVDVEPYDAVVLGSAVYAGHWLEPARRFVAQNRAALAARPVWLFSSGPVGEVPMPTGDPADVAQLREQTGAREHRVFAGRIDKAQLGLGERVIVRAVGAREGDFRPWAEIEAWAAGIALSLRAAAPVREAVPA